MGVVQQEQLEDLNLARQAPGNLSQWRLQYCCYVVVDWQRAFPVAAGLEVHRARGSLIVALAGAQGLENMTLGLVGIGPETWSEGVEVRMGPAQETLGERET
jgi:hypothetical protein